MLVRFIALVSTMVVTALGPALAQSAAQSTPPLNPYSSAARYGARHDNPAEPTSFPYAVEDGTFHVELPKFPRIMGGPGTYLQWPATDPDYLWVTTTGSVVYADISNKRLREVARLATPGAYAIPGATFDKVTAQPVTNVDHARALVKELGVDERRLRSNAHAVVDKDNVLYAPTSEGVVHAYALIDTKRPTAGISIARSLDLRPELKKLDASRAKSELKQAASVTALGLTHDGHIVVGTSRSVVVTARSFSGPLHTVQLGADETVTNSVALDAKGGIYVASDKAMHKLVWTGQRLSRDAADGAWSSPYDLGREPGTVKVGRGTGSTPTLMGFGSDPDKLVVITDGANRMKVVAFWRDAIPLDFQQRPGTKSRRIAGQLEVGAGLAPRPEFIQSEQPVVVHGYGAFVVNNVRARGDSDRLVDLITGGPVHAPPRGVERLDWDPKKRQWRSIWTRNDVGAPSMTPAVSTASNMVLINQYTKADGWELTGMDWKTGTTVHRSIFGQDPLGNGAGSFLQFLPNGDLLFNSIGGPIRIRHLAVIARPKT